MIKRILFWLLWIVIAAFVIGIVVVASAVGQTIQLSEGRAFSSIYFSSSLPALSPDSKWAVYVQDATVDGANELWSVNVAGGAPVRLSNALTFGQSVKFIITPDSQRVVYQVDQDTRGVPEVYSVPIGGGVSVKLNKSLTAANGRVRDFIVSPTSQRVYYAADADSFTVLELWSVPILGGTSTQLNESFAVDYDVFEYAASPQDRVVYRVGRTVQGGHTLWMNHGTGTSAQAKRISYSPMVVGGGVSSHFEVHGELVVYLADAESNGDNYLYSVPVTGGDSTRLDTFNDRNIRDFVLDGPFVYYSYSNTEWYKVSIFGGTSAPATKPTLPPVTSPDGLWTVYPVGSSLWSSGPSGQRRVSCAGQVVTATFLTKPTYSVSGDSTTVLFVADGELWAGPISGSACEIFNDGFESGGVTRWN